MASPQVIFSDSPGLTLLRDKPSDSGGNKAVQGTSTAWGEYSATMPHPEPFTGQCTLEGLTNCNSRTGHMVFSATRLWSDNDKFQFRDDERPDVTVTAAPINSDVWSTGTDPSDPMTHIPATPYTAIVTFESINHQIIVTRHQETAVWVALLDRHPVYDQATSLITMKLYDTHADPQVLTFAHYPNSATRKVFTHIPVNGLYSRSALAIFNNVGLCRQFTLHLNWPYKPGHTMFIKKAIDERIQYGPTYPAEILQKSIAMLKFIRVNEKDPLLGTWYGDWTSQHPGLGIYIVWWLRWKIPGGKSPPCRSPT